MKKLMFAASAAVVLAATPITGQGVTVNVTNFQQRYPWNGLVDIDYTITRNQGEPEVDPAKYSVEISVVNCAETIAVTNVAHAFHQGALPVSDGAHRVTWDANAEGINFKSQDVKIFAEIVHYAEKYMVINISEGPGATDYHVTYLHGAPEGGFNKDEYKGDNIVLRFIPPGSFVMGSPTTEPGRGNTAAREVQHAVAITKPFYIGVFEVTQTQYLKVMGGNKPSMWGEDGRHPAEAVSYDSIRGAAVTQTHLYDWPDNQDVDMQNSFMGKLRSKCKEMNLSGEWVPVSGLFDLPTEAQWEYACRAGTTTPFNDGIACVDNAALEKQLESRGCYKKNAVATSHAVVGSYDENDWGLYDMHGNVWEWCRDWYQEDALTTVENSMVDPSGPSAGSGTPPTRSVHGGCYKNEARDCRSASRNGAVPTGAYAAGDRGFRLSMTLP